MYIRKYNHYLRYAAKSRSRRILTAIVLTPAGIALVCLVFYVKMYHSGPPPVKPMAPQTQTSAAELTSAAGMVLVRRPGGGEWREVRTGARLAEGDLIRTDVSGNASIRYSNGTVVFIQKETILTVQNAGNGRMEISAPAAFKPGVTAAASKERLKGTILGEAMASELMPSIALQQIIPFGRSLELIGHVEAGSSLIVNNENVEVAGDGFFRHFTNPFPAASRKALLFIKVTDLAGRTRTVAITHDFSPHDGDH